MPSITFEGAILLLDILRGITSVMYFDSLASSSTKAASDITPIDLFLTGSSGTTPDAGRMLPGDESPCPTDQVGDSEGVKLMVNCVCSK